MSIQRLRGFVFSIDVIVGIIAIVILAGITLQAAPGFLNNAKSSRALTDTASLASYVSEYRNEIGSYPKTLSKLTEKEGQYGPWIADLPKDPWSKKDYNYKYSDDDGVFSVYSGGPNKTDNSSYKAIGEGNVGFIGK